MTYSNENDYIFYDYYLQFFIITKWAEAYPKCIFFTLPKQLYIVTL